MPDGEVIYGGIFTPKSKGSLELKLSVLILRIIPLDMRTFWPFGPNIRVEG